MVADGVVGAASAAGTQTASTNIKTKHRKFIDGVIFNIDTLRIVIEFQRIKIIDMIIFTVWPKPENRMDTIVQWDQCTAATVSVPRKCWLGFTLSSQAEIKLYIDTVSMSRRHWSRDSYAHKYI